MKPRLARVLLVVSVALNLALIVVLVAMAASGSIADRVAPRLHLTSSEDERTMAAENDDLDARLSNAESQLDDLASSDVGGTLDDLDARVSDLEDEVGSSFRLGDLSSRVDDAEGKLDDACSAAGSAATQSIGTDAFYAFLDLQRALCGPATTPFPRTPTGRFRERSPYGDARLDTSTPLLRQTWWALLGGAWRNDWRHAPNRAVEAFVGRLGARRTKPRAEPQ
jgi:hypothetical protein